MKTPWPNDCMHARQGRIYVVQMVAYYTYIKLALLMHRSGRDDGARGSRVWLDFAVYTFAGNLCIRRPRPVEDILRSYIEVFLLRVMAAAEQQSLGWCH